MTIVLEFFDVIRKMQMLFIRTALPAISEYGLSKTEIYVLMSVFHHKSFRVTDLAKIADIPASTFTGVIDRLVRKDYLIRVNDPQDRRSVLVQGTQHLRDTVEKLMEEFNILLAKLLEPVPKELILNTVDNLKHIYDLTSKQSEECMVKSCIEN